MLAVLPKCRKHGIATKLIEGQIQYAVDNRFKRITVKSSPRWKNMLRLLLKLDFVISGYKANEWENEPAIFLEKDL
jgi:GNAT superfamily N-acetyltransferase